MRKRPALIFACVLVSSGFVAMSPAQFAGSASAKSSVQSSLKIVGTKCTKSDAMKKVSGVTYKCTKSGKTFKWIKIKTTTTSTTTTKLKENDACDRIGVQVELDSGYLECRLFSDDSRKYVKLSSNSATPTMPAGGSDLEACKLREARTTKFQPWNVGFPRGDGYGTSTLPTSGRANVQLVAVDFSDALGTAGELVDADLEIAEFNKWFTFHSNNTLTFNWQFPKRWLRMPRTTSGYGLIKGDRTTVLAMAQDVVTVADQFVDFTASDFVFVLFPKSIKLGSPDLGMANWRVESAEGPVKNLFGGSEYFYDRGYDLWSFWIHEWGHPMGLAGHTPRSVISIMDDQNGKSVMLNAWDSFFTGWLGNDQLYCMPIADKSLEISLIPLERLQHGPRSVIVPISSTNALVIESHRAEGWGKRMLNESYGSTKSIASYGVAVYYIDTTQDTNRYAQSSGYTDSDLGERWADHVVPTGATRAFDLLMQGDTVTYRGVTVAFTKTGDVDTVKITK